MVYGISCHDSVMSASFYVSCKEHTAHPCHSKLLTAYKFNDCYILMDSCFDSFVV